MTSKERVHASLDGRPVDRMPVTTLYAFLYHLDHFAELTGLPAWRRHEWACLPPDRYVERLALIQRNAPFEILQPLSVSRQAREEQEFVVRDGRPYRHDKRKDTWLPLDTPTVSGHANDYAACETATVFDLADVRKKVHVEKAEALVAAGLNDYAEAVVAAFGATEFILTGGVVGTVYSCGAYAGQTRTFTLMHDDPSLLDELCKRILERNIEVIRCVAAAGGDAIYIDDATATSDMISRAHYERFSLPYMREMVREIHRLGQKAFVIYFGGVMDRMEQIASIGADGFLMESSMKGYVNDIAAAVSAIGTRVTFFSNIDPVGILQNATDADMEAEIRRQADAGRRGRGFVLSPSSPITPATPLARVQRFIELGRSIGQKRQSATGSAVLPPEST